MPYKRLRGGTIYNQKLANAAAILRQIRQLIAKLTEGDINHAQLYQYLTAITLNTTRLDDILADLAAYDDKPTADE